MFTIIILHFLAPETPKSVAEFGEMPGLGGRRIRLEGLELGCRCPVRGNC